MAETALSVTALAQYSKGVADVGYEAADQANGNTFANTGFVVLLIRNDGGAPTTCTATAPASAKTYNEAITKDVTVASGGATGVLGPFPADIFGTDPTVAWTNDTSVTVAAVDFAAALRTPK